MPVPIILAHGALGPFDELIMLGAAVIFLVMIEESLGQKPQHAP